MGSKRLEEQGFVQFCANLGRPAEFLILRILIEFDALAKLLVLVADEFDRFLVGHEPLIDTHGEWLGVRFRILHLDVDFELPERGPAKAFRESRLLTVWTAAHIEPSIVWTGFGAA